MFMSFRKIRSSTKCFQFCGFLTVVLWHLRFIFLSVWSPNPPQWYHAQWIVYGSCDSVPSYDAMHTLSEQHLSLHSMHIESGWLMIYNSCMPTVDGFHYFTTIGCQVFQGYCPLLSGQTRLNQKQGDSISSILVKIRLPGLWKGCNFASKLNEDTVNYVFQCFLRKFHYLQQTRVWNFAHLNDLRSDLSHLFDPAGTLMSKCKDMAKADLSRWLILRKRAVAPHKFSRHRNRRTTPKDLERNQNCGISKNTWPARRAFSSPAGPFAWY